VARGMGGCGEGWAGNFPTGWIIGKAVPSTLGDASASANKLATSGKLNVDAVKSLAPRYHVEYDISLARARAFTLCFSE
jgi:hypothetical protein